MEKDVKSKLNQLVIKRRANVPVGYYDFSDYRGGIYDSPYNVTPWSVCAGNFDTKLMIIGQDWASDGRLSQSCFAVDPAVGRDPNLITNRNLDSYLELFNLKWSEIYATNAFAFVKPGSMGARIPKTIFDYSIRDFLIPQLEIIKPKMAICLGSQTYNALSRCLGFPAKLISEAHLSHYKWQGICIFGVFHPGGQGTANAGGRQKAQMQWKHLADWYFSLTN